MTDTFGPRQEAILSAWKQTVPEHPTGPGYDLSESNRTRVCTERLDEFIEDPSKETFQELWDLDALYESLSPNKSLALDSFWGSVEELAELFAEVRDAETYDPAWERKFQWSQSLWELYGRTHAETSPIPTSQAASGLKQFGFAGGNTYNKRVDSLERFAETYRERVGHVTAGTDHEVPVWVEIDELLALVTTVDPETIRAEVDGPRGPLYRSLDGYGSSGSTETNRPIRLDYEKLAPAIDGHLAARESGAYQDETTEHWGGTHIESWKWEYAKYFEETIREKYDITDLDPEELDSFFADLDVGMEPVSSVLNHMMGRWGASDWNAVRKHCLENPEEGAAVISDLLTEDAHVTDRLGALQNFCAPLDVSPGNLMRFASTLLMFAYPEDYITFQYSRFDSFFAANSSVDGLDTGFRPTQYWQVVLACRELRDVLREERPDADMIDVHTLVYVWNDWADESA
ncbi:hypothetical protein [Haloarchaeobius sp. TZWSO28]|uniref:hypothetical protein n=1 Tax=Haloarchaeobius sp. TZWSO28 TaxID=3446119 RepID=UPI003EBB8F3B